MARVLIAEDEPKIAQLLADYLTQAGHDALTVGEGDRVLASIDAERPDLLLLDIMLPGMDGLSVLRELRRDSECFAPAMPVACFGAKDYPGKVFCQQLAYVFMHKAAMYGDGCGSSAHHA